VPAVGSQPVFEPGAIVLEDQPLPRYERLHRSDAIQAVVLGIPTMTDRLIQQALLQVLQPQIDPTFSELRQKNNKTTCF